MINTDNVTNDVQIGHDNYSAGGYVWNGDLDAIRIYSEVLSESEIASLAGVSTAISDLAAAADCKVSSLKSGKIQIVTSRAGICSMYAMNGQKVHQVMVNAGTTIIQTGLSRGIYMVKIESRNQDTFIRKVYVD